MVKWVELAKQRLEPEDHLQRSYYARYEGKAGPLVISNRKLVFIEEKGFLRKTYDLVIEIPLEKISDVTVENVRLTITDMEGKRYDFTTETSASIVEEHLRELMPISGATP